MVEKTRNQFASNRTRVRIPPAAPEQPAGSSGRLLFYSFAQQAIKSGHVGPPSHGLKISGARAQSARMRVKNSSCADCFYPFLLESLDLSMKSDYNKRIESEIGYGGMHMGQGPGIREFNRLYKELDDLYHNLALRQGLSDSASIILYAL